MAKKPTKSRPAQPTTEIVYRLHTLLHTMRAIERHEEKICSILTEVERSGSVTQECDEELRDILEQMPAHEYEDDIQAVRSALTPALRESA